MEWPHYIPETQGYHTTDTEKAVWKRAIDACLSDITRDTKELRPRVLAFKQRLNEILPEDWNRMYRDILEEFTSIMASVSNEQALDIAQAGLDALHDLMLFQIDNYTIIPVKDVFVLTRSFQKLETEELTGTKAPDIDFQFGLTNPANLQDTLFGYDACAQVDAWQEYGALETSAAVLAKSTFVHASIPSLLSNKRFVVLGCTSDLGPTKSLVNIPGATVYGVARAGKRFDDLLDYVRYNAPDDTTFVYPKGGADLLTQGPQIAQWILDAIAPEMEIVLCPMAYAEGEANVRVCVAMDLIIQRILRQRENTILCQYSSPTTAMVLPPSAATNAQRRLDERPRWEQWTSKISMGKWLQPSLPTSNNDYALLNGIVTSQGSTHVLSKMIQTWRAMIAYYRDAHVVAAPFAPPTRTASMIYGSNESMASTMEGMHHFEPMLAFDSGPASTLMAAILVSQIQFMNRPLPDVDENPYTMFWDGAGHGGVWNCPYSLESISTINWVLGKAYYGKGYVPKAALAKSQEERDADDANKPDPEEVLKEMENSQFGQPMPDCGKERLDFM